ncbi:MAG: hypothetical protein QOG84_1931 [Sphingomonadales bacterium]|jgi:hypothetical protein|nr:hypothetical protein [Sphingomonadales bacterium]
MSELARAIAEKRVILFVGSGVSASLGTPDWSGLIDHMGEELGYDPDLFSSASNSYLTLAEYYRIKVDSIGPLRSWMDTHWHVSKEKLKNSAIHKLIIDLDFPLIYTTNFDRFLEQTHDLHRKPYTKIANVRDIREAREGQTQIIKLHGDFDDDKSLVITESNYFERLSFESPLDIKLRANSLGRSLLFIGYSLSDINIRLLLYKLSQTWTNSGLRQHRPPSYLFQHRPDPIQEAVMNEWGVRFLTEDVDDPGTALTAFLEKLARAATPALGCASGDGETP